MGDLNDSNLEFCDQDERDKFIISPMSRSVRNLEGNFTDIVNPYGLTNETNSYREFTTRKESNTTNFLKNGGFKLISVV